MNEARARKLREWKELEAEIITKDSFCLTVPPTMVVSCMNLKPGGKRQPKEMKDSFNYRDGMAQPMIFPADHPTYPGEPRGIKVVLQERGIWRYNLRL